MFVACREPQQVCSLAKAAKPSIASAFNEESGYHRPSVALGHMVTGRLSFTALAKADMGSPLTIPNGVDPTCSMLKITGVSEVGLISKMLACCICL